MRCGLHCATPKSDFAKRRSKRSKAAGRDLADTLQFWFRKTYRLAPNDPIFLALTVEEIEREFWAWHYSENRGNVSESEVEDEDFDKDAILRQLESGGWEDLINERN